MSVPIACNVDSHKQKRQESVFGNIEEKKNLKKSRMTLEEGYDNTQLHLEIKERGLNLKISNSFLI